MKTRKIMPNHWNWFFCSILFSKICPKLCSSIKAIFSGSLVRPRKMRASRHLSQYEIRASSVIFWLSSPLKIAKATKTDSIWSKGRPNIGLKRRKWSNDKMAGKFCIFSVNPHVFTLFKQNKQILTSFLQLYRYILLSRRWYGRHRRKWVFKVNFPLFWNV